VLTRAEFGFPRELKSANHSKSIFQGLLADLFLEDSLHVVESGNDTNGTFFALRFESHKIAASILRVNLSEHESLCF
jgi:hypothetical protein